MSSDQRIVILGNNRAACLVLESAATLFGESNLMAVAPPPGSFPDWHDDLSVWADRLGIKSYAPDNINAEESVAALTAFRPDLLLSVYYTQIFRRPLLDELRCPVLNVHPSLLPRHRGTAPLIWAIAEGDETTGVTLHHVDRGIDTGGIILQRSLPIHPDDTGYDLHGKAADLVLAVCEDLFAVLSNQGTVPDGEEQRGVATTHTNRDPRINRVSWEDSAARVRDVVRALAPPLPTAYTEVSGVRIDLHEVRPVSARGAARAAGSVDAGPDGVARIWTTEGPVALQQVAVDGRLLVRPALGDHRVLYDGAMAQ